MRRAFGEAAGEMREGLARRVESSPSAVAVARAYPLLPVSSGSASIARP